ncbi:WXG100 family type VII secretion target [Nocardia paucivorans]|uniref:WXG100 family type VII secretion target n=1 Tax=Nocardia paucivorans TaxID=114259 RepID=UPI0002DB0ECB|nr:hypothetical protein [Nocardia paucivorans]
MTSLPPTKTQIRAWNTAPLADQGAEWTRAAQAVLDQHGAVSRQLADSPGFWRGDAADAMRGKGDEARSSLSKVAAALDKGGTVSTRIAQSLSAAKTTAVDAIAAAEAERFIVAEDGSVGFDQALPAWTMAEHGVSQLVARMVLRSGAEQHRNVIQAALRAAADAAESARTTLDQVFADVPIPPAAELEAILNKYQVQADPDGMVTWPDEGVLGFLGEKLDKAKLVTVAEAEMLDRLSLGDKVRFYRMMTEAEDTALGMYPGDLEQDDHTDAFRHIYWNALMTQEFGPEWTQEYASKHEGRPDNAAVREAMDLHNNEVGRNIALQNPDASPEELRELVRQAVERGDAVVINQDRTLSWSNQVPIGQTVDSQVLDANATFLPGSPVSDNNPSPK